MSESLGAWVPESIQQIYNEAVQALGSTEPLHWGPAHIVWEDLNFDCAQSCLDNFDEWAGYWDLPEGDLTIVRKSLEALAALDLDEGSVDGEIVGLQSSLTEIALSMQKSLDAMCAVREQLDRGELSRNLAISITEMEKVFGYFCYTFAEYIGERVEPDNEDAVIAKLASLVGIGLDGNELVIDWQGFPRSTK